MNLSSVINLVKVLVVDLESGWKFSRKGCFSITGHHTHTSILATSMFSGGNQRTWRKPTQNQGSESVYQSSACPCVTISTPRPTGSQPSSCLYRYFTYLCQTCVMIDRKAILCLVDIWITICFDKKSYQSLGIIDGQYGLYKISTSIGCALVLISGDLCISKVTFISCTKLVTNIHKKGSMFVVFVKILVVIWIKLEHGQLMVMAGLEQDYIKLLYRYKCMSFLAIAPWILVIFWSHFLHPSTSGFSGSNLWTN